MAATPRDQGAISGQNLLSAAAQILVAAETSRLRANREVMPFAVLGAKLPTDPSGDDPMGPRPADTGIRHPSPAPVRIGGHVVHRRRRRWCHGTDPGASLGQELALRAPMPTRSGGFWGPLRPPGPAWGTSPPR